MRIDSFQINGFGLFSDVTGENLSPGLNIFFGCNEAGKSTCLEFFRVMLTGYPDKSSKRRSFDVLGAGRPGGSLRLSFHGGEMRLSRSPASYGGLTLYDGAGSPLHVDDLLRVMGGVNREVYCRVFGFSLEELERWDKKSEDSVRNALYGASFGPGLLPPGEALAKLDKEMGKIFKPRGASQPLAQDLLRLTSVQTKIRQWEDQCAGYNTLALNLSQAQEHLTELAAKKERLELERLRLEGRLGARQQWEQWRILNDKLAKLPEPSARFPEDARARLSRISAEKDACARDVAAAQETLRQLETREASLAVNAQLLAELPLLRRLSENRVAFRQAEKALDDLHSARQKAETDLASVLAMLGPGWSCERIRQTDRSLFAREGMEKRAAELTTTRQSHQAATDALAYANGEHNRAQAALTAARERLAALPQPATPISEEDRDALQRGMARLEESRRMAPAREKSLQSAQQTFRRAMAQSQVFTPPHWEDGATPDSAMWEEKAVKTLDAILNHQEKALDMAREIESAVKGAEDSERRLAEAEGEAEEIKGKIEERQLAQRLAGGTTREALDARGRALRALRNLGNKIAAEEEKQKELEAAINRLKEQTPSRNFTLVAFGCLLLIAALGIGCAWYFLGLDRLDLGNDLYIPINLWAAYICLFCGVVLFAGGFSSHGPEQRRQKEELAQLLARREASSMHLVELGAQARQICQEQNVDDFDPITIDTMEMLLESDRERLIHEERSGQEIEAMEKDLAATEDKARHLRQEAQQREQAVQQARRRWHDLMQGLALDQIPSPESAQAVFARLEAAKGAWENVQNGRRELDFLWEDLHETETALTSMPAIQTVLTASLETIGLEEAVNKALAACREADMAREQRLRAEADITSAEAALDGATRRQAEAYVMLENAASRLGDAHHEWVKGLENLSLNPDLDPETMREAYKYMDACLVNEDRLHESERALLEAETETDAFRESLKAVLQRLGREATGATVDWAGMLEELLAEAEAQKRQEERQQDLRESMSEQRNRLASLTAALTTAQEAENALLRQGGAETADEFLALATTRDERRELGARKAELETLLAQSARGEAMDAFMASFQQEDIMAQELRLRRVREGIGRIADDEKATIEKIGSMQARVDTLADTEELSRLRQEEALLKETIARQAQRWEELALARELLRQGRVSFEKDRQPAIIRNASALFNKITGGRWEGLSLNLEDSSLLVLPKHGDPVSPVNLSRGAQEQAYLAIRLAYIKQHAMENEPLPVIMDEILVNFDPERARRTAETLAEMIADGEQQILYFTCQPHTVALLQETFSKVCLFKLENGQIERLGNVKMAE